MKDLLEIVSELQLGVMSRKKADIVQVLVTHAPNCQQLNKSAVTRRNIITVLPVYLSDIFLAT